MPRMYPHTNQNVPIRDIVIRCPASGKMVMVQEPLVTTYLKNADEEASRESPRNWGTKTIQVSPIYYKTLLHLCEQAVYKDIGETSELVSEYEKIPHILQ